MKDISTEAFKLSRKVIGIVSRTFAAINTLPTKEALTETGIATTTMV